MYVRVPWLVHDLVNLRCFCLLAVVNNAIEQGWIHSIYGYTPNVWVPSIYNVPGWHGVS